MLGDGDDEAATGLEDPMGFVERPGVVRDVLQDVERSHELKLRAERKVSRVGLHERHIRPALPRDRQPLFEQLRAGQARRRQGLPQRAQGVAGATSDLQHGSRHREGLADGSLQ
jgi:hypothetical protein